MHLLLKATEEFQNLVSSGKSFILIDLEGFGEGFSEGRVKIPFMEKNGIYHGMPGNDENAILEFNRLLESKPDFFVLGWPAFWVTDYYPDFFKLVTSNYKCILSNERLKVFDLTSGIE
jgi:hypothetical protein